jgi:hypothetical protein
MAEWLRKPRNLAIVIIIIVVVLVILWWIFVR